ncbi:unnamed protein product [Periconia digitata]|uniref:Uncharacterized protein n=1 Tax=Periconia digitata TaxID=1303443 RepID=A0A9W4UAD4_9PLEO|nr:unnamed protein product [Periconia digitata]
MDAIREELLETRQLVQDSQYLLEHKPLYQVPAYRAAMLEEIAAEKIKIGQLERKLEETSRPKPQEEPATFLANPSSRPTQISASKYAPSAEPQIKPQVAGQSTGYTAMASNPTPPASAPVPRQPLPADKQLGISVADTQSELADLKSEMANLKSELADTKFELAHTKSELAMLKAQFQANEERVLLAEQIRQEVIDAEERVAQEAARIKKLREAED